MSEPLTADTITDEQIRALRCAICSEPAACVGRYEEPGEPACNECCGHGCEDGSCDLLYDEDGDITQDLAWADDKDRGTRMRARCAEILNARKARS